MTDVETKMLLVLGERLKTAREKCGLSYRKVQEITGINKTTLSNMEKGKHNPKTTTWLRLTIMYEKYGH